IAAFTTGIVRALLIETVNKLPPGAWLGSITTDGFLCDVTLDEIDQSGPIAELFRAARARITPEKDNIFEYKHQEEGVYLIKTRGVVSISSRDWCPTINLKKPQNRLLAKVSYRSGRHSGYTVEHCSYWMEMIRQRTYETKTQIKSFIPAVKQHLTEADLTMEEREARLNLCWDQKRKLINIRNIDGLITADTVPHETIDDYYTERNAQDEWRKSQRQVLKTVEDYNNFQNWKNLHANRQITGTKADNSFSTVAIAVTKGAAHALFGFVPAPQASIAAALTRLCGRQVSIAKVKDVKRRGSKVEDLLGGLSSLDQPDIHFIRRLYHDNPAVITYVDMLIARSSSAEIKINQVIMLEGAYDDYEANLNDGNYDQAMAIEATLNTIMMSHRSENGVEANDYWSNRHLGLKTVFYDEVGGALSD
ncbi:MAG: hypothetical protein EB015_19830, partial [Methylocystaceae bacterium]|nr:hypothetical protein [Methylocystaceae bacterium]